MYSYFIIYSVNIWANEFSNNIDTGGVLIAFYLVSTLINIIIVLSSVIYYIIILCIMLIHYVNLIGQNHLSKITIIFNLLIFRLTKDLK